MADCVLVTGAAGTIGRPFVNALADWPSIARVIALRHTAPLVAERSQVRVLAGDVTANQHLDLSSDEAASLTPEITTIVHAAATTRFDMPAAAARAVNVAGLRNVMSFARQCPRLERLLVLSTVHVAGRRSGLILEDDLEHDAGFVNSYEASKYEAELEARAAMRDLPVAVARISTVTGDSCSGVIAKRAAVHQAVRFMFAGLAPMVPGAEDSPADVVALDYVVRSLVWLAAGGFEPGATFHICAGADAVPLGELLDLTLQTFAEHRPSWRKRAIERPAIVALPTFELFCQSVEQAGDATLRAATAVIARFAPQLAFAKQFDDRRCAAALSRAGISRPSTRVAWTRMVKQLIQPDRNLEDALLNFVRTELLAGREVQVDPDTYLFESGLLDSLKILQLIAFLERQTGSTIPDRDIVMSNFRSVRTMAAYFGNPTCQARI